MQTFLFRHILKHTVYRHLLQDVQIITDRINTLKKLIPFFITRLLDNKKVPVYGDGQNVRDWLYVEDHCRGIDLVLHKGCDGEIYNIGGHNEKTNIEITKIILEKMGKDENCIEYVEDRLGHDRRYAISNDKIRNKLGFEVKYSFENGISDTIDWYLKNIEWINNIKTVWRSINEGFSNRCKRNAWARFMPCF